MAPWEPREHAGFARVRPTCVCACVHACVHACVFKTDFPACGKTHTHTHTFLSVEGQPRWEWRVLSGGHLAGGGVFAPRDEVLWGRYRRGRDYVCLEAHTQAIFCEWEHTMSVGFLGTASPAKEARCFSSVMHLKGRASVCVCERQRDRDHTFPALLRSGCEPSTGTSLAHAHTHFPPLTGVGQHFCLVCCPLSVECGVHLEQRPLERDFSESEGTLSGFCLDTACTRYVPGGSWVSRGGG